MPKWNRSTGIACVVATIAVYFSTALWLKHSYVEPPKPAGELFRLSRPFFELRDSDIAFAANAPLLDGLSDSSETPRRSPFLLFENDRPLGPAHSEHAEIKKSGGGRFSHWEGSGFIFSTSDGTNPKSNGRTYWAVIPPPPAK
jgi:hypothetical protein